jgi:hypothetical protein
MIIIVVGRSFMTCLNSNADLVNNKEGSINKLVF